MLTLLHLKQFKAWADSGPIALKPITLLLGTNLSGQSSLIQSLMLLKQTVESPDRTIHLNLGGDERNDVFIFGDFSSILTQGSTDRQFEIHVTFRRGSTEERINAGAFRCRLWANCQWDRCYPTPSSQCTARRAILPCAAPRKRCFCNLRGARCHNPWEQSRLCP